MPGKTRDKVYRFTIQLDEVGSPAGNCLGDREDDPREVQDTIYRIAIDPRREQEILALYYRLVNAMMDYAPR